MPEEKEKNTPEETPVTENNEEVDEDFADAHPYVAPAEEEAKKEEAPVEEEDEPLEEEPEIPEPPAASYEYNDPALAKIEEARVNWIKAFKKKSRIKTIVSVIALAAILSAWLVPTLTIRNQGLLPMYIGLGAALLGAVGLFVFNAIHRKKDQELIHQYFIAYYEALNEYTLKGNGVEVYEGKVDDKVAQEEFDATNLFPEAKQIGSRDNVTFSYQGMDCALADAAAQKDSGKGLVTCFVGKFLRTHNTLDISEEGITIYYRGNKRALVPASLNDKPLLEKTKYVRIYGASADKKILTDKVRAALKEIHTDRLLCDVSIVFKPGKTYFFLGYEDDIMVLPHEKPFNPKYVMAYKQQLKTFLNIALLFNKERPNKGE